MNYTIALDCFKKRNVVNDPWTMTNENETMNEAIHFNKRTFVYIVLIESILIDDLNWIHSVGFVYNAHFQIYSITETCWAVGRHCRWIEQN